MKNTSNPLSTPTRPIPATTRRTTLLADQAQTPPIEDAIQAAIDATKAGRAMQVIDIVRAIVSRDEDIGDRWGLVADLAADAGDRFSAVRAQRKFAAAKPRDDDRRMKLSRMLNSAGRTEEAFEIAQALQKKHPTSAPAAFRTGNFAFFLGDMDCAKDMFWRVVKLDPNDVESWNQLVKLEKFELGDKAYGQMEALRDRLRKAGASKTKELSNLHYALGDAYDRIGEYDKAYENYAEGQAIMAAERPYDVAGERAYVERIKRTFSAALYKKLEDRGMGAESSRPIFIFGMPRSGTTLLEQLLTTHSQVKDGGELDAMRVAAFPLGRLDPQRLNHFQRNFGGPGGDPFGKLGQIYLRFVDEEFGPESEGRVVDKALDLPYHAGAAMAALPNASFVWIRRDPRDVALSVLKTRFLVRHDWTWAWERIAERMVQVEDLQRYFLELFPEKLLFIPYESLAAEPDVWAPKLLEHAGLPVEDVQNNFYKTDRAVKTASKTQVRQPISTKSIGGWRRYEEHMQPFLEAYEKARPSGWGNPYQAP